MNLLKTLATFAATFTTRRVSIRGGELNPLFAIDRKISMRSQDLLPNVETAKLFVKKLGNLESQHELYRSFNCSTLTVVFDLAEKKDFWGQGPDKLNWKDLINILKELSEENKSSFLRRLGHDCIKAALTETKLGKEEISRQGLKFVIDMSPQSNIDELKSFETQLADCSKCAEEEQWEIVSAHFGDEKAKPLIFDEFSHKSGLSTNHAKPYFEGPGFTCPVIAAQIMETQTARHVP